MSNDMDSSDVIVIAPKAKNEDGSQTFYILDPCPSSEECTNEPPESEIEIVSDVTAEVKNTVAFALLSTNSDTGALEIRLTKKAATEENSDAQSEMDLHLDHLNNSLVAVAKDIRDEVINCTLNVNTDKDEQFDNGSFTNQNASVSSNVSESVHAPQTDSSIAEVEQEDDPEEGKLYIDDIKDSELKNDPVQEHVEDLDHIKAAVDEYVNNPTLDGSSNSNLCIAEEPDIKPVNPTEQSCGSIVPDETKNTSSSVNNNLKNESSEKDVDETQESSVNKNLQHESSEKDIDETQESSVNKNLENESSEKDVDETQERSVNKNLKIESYEKDIDGTQESSVKENLENESSEKDVDETQECSVNKNLKIESYEKDIDETQESSVKENLENESSKKEVGESCEKDVSETQEVKIKDDMPHDSFIGHAPLVQSNLIEVPSETQCIELKTDDSEYGDSTKTALTLLELAGGTSLRHENIQRSSDFSIKADAPCTSEDVEKFDDVSGISCNPSESVILTTLHPVQTDIEIIQEAAEEDSNTGTDVLIKPEISIHKSLTADKLCNDQVQRLIDGDTPMLGSKGSFGKRKSHRGVVTQNEIVEIYERTKQKSYYSEPSKDIIFAMKLAHRLATKIVPPEKTSNLESDSEVDKLGVAPSSSSPRGDRPGGLLSVTDNDRSENKTLISDKIELLKILEDDPDDPGTKTGEVQKLEIVHTPKIKKQKLQRSPLIKRHPELEKELALKQLQTFSENRRKKGRPSTSITVVTARVEQDSGKTMVKDEPEDNNNLNSTKELRRIPKSLRKRVSDAGCTPRKKIKGESSTEAVTVDPMQITETLTIDDGKIGEQEEQVKEGKYVKQYSNKRLSRNVETPPREVPIEILLNGDNNNCDNADKTEESTTKNKIFKASNPGKRKEELKRTRQKHFANVLQRNKPLKRRGRPPGKKKTTTLENIFDEEVIDNFKRPLGNENESGSNIESGPLKKQVKQVKSRKLREIERLLGDEGAINMLYSVEQKRVTGSEPKRGMLPSYRRKKKDLILKTKLVKTAVLRLSTSPSQTSGRVSLRGQTLKDEKESADESSSRKQSVDSDESHNVLDYPQITTQPQPIKKAPAEASRIIRRHSSSSNYSSRSNSPRRPSIDSAVHDMSSDIGLCETPISSDSTKYKNKVKSTQSKESCLKRKELIDDGRKETAIDESKLPNKRNKREAIVKFKSNEKEDALKMQSPVSSKQPGKLVSFKDKETSSDLSTSLGEAVKDFTKECRDNVTTKDNAVGKITPSVTRSGNARKAAGNISVYKKATPTQSHGSGVKSSCVYNELNLKRHNHLIEINIDPASTKLKNSLNTHVLKELTLVLKGLAKDENCHIVLISSSGSVFCQGVDFVSLIQPTADKRMAAAHEMAVAIKDFMMALAVFPKPIVAGVQGAAVGLGTAMLPLFDMVFSSGEATFHTPYAKLGQVPEGGASLTLPTLYGPSLTSELLLAARKLSAAEAHHFGLVTRILWGNNFNDELIAVLSIMASQSSQAMDATKVLLRHNMLPGLETALMSETHLLMQHWTGAECQANFNLYLQENDPSASPQKVTI